MSDPVYRMPTIAEVLGGETQGGVPRPAVDTDAAFAAKAVPAARVAWWQRLRAILEGLFV